MPANHPSVSRSLSDQSAPDASSQVPGAAAWKPWKVVIAFVAVVGLALAGRATVASSGEGPLLGIAIALMLLSVAPVGLALLLANVDATPTARDFGLVRPRFVRALALMFAVLIGLMAMFVLWSAALGLDEDAGTPLAERLGTEGTLNVLILVVVLTVLGPLGEELSCGRPSGELRSMTPWRSVQTCPSRSPGLSLRGLTAVEPLASGRRQAMATVRRGGVEGRRVRAQRMR